MFLARQSLIRRFFSFKAEDSRLKAFAKSDRIKFVFYGSLVGFIPISYWLYNSSNSAKTSELAQDHFTRYEISYKQNIDNSHFLMELTPLVKQKTNLWRLMGSEKMWSVQIKQPEIMVVRNYTPLPLLANKKDGTLDIMSDGNFAGGKLMFYLKRYKDGEVARWLHDLPEGAIIELRGPYLEYELPEIGGELNRSRQFLTRNGPTKNDSNRSNEIFKYQPFDIVMYTAGTGIVTALQLLLTERPFRGTLELFHCCKDFNELGPLKYYLLQLQDHKRLKLHLLESFQVPDRELRLQKLMNESSAPFPYDGITAFKKLSYDDIRPVLALVCGPDSFISAISGPKAPPYQGPIQGILEKKGWTNDNLFKLS